ncbi:MAG: DUF1704 domain-containing protein [Patescibacteria group bacterium]|nr:DUF1704 domain-containing protein [Patescibacteria group bacterium]
MNRQSLAKNKMTLSEVSELMSQIATPWSLYLVPNNLEAEKEKFFESSSYNPKFTYRKPEAADRNKVVFGALSGVEEITDVDPELSKYIILVIQAKREAADILEKIGNDEKFAGVSLKRFGEPSYWLFRRACKILRGKYSNFTIVEQNDRLRKKVLQFDELVPIFETVFARLGLEGWTIGKSKAIIEAGFRTAVKTRRIMVDPEIKITAEKLRKTIVHEVATHALRGHNGFATGFEVFGKPNLPEYLDDEEGLAFYNEEKFGVLRATDLKRRAAQVYSIYLGQSMSFRRTHNALSAVYPKKTAFNIVLRVKRGLSDTSKPGCHFKDATYLRGFLRIRKKLSDDAVSYRNMYAGKLPMKYLYLVEEGILPKPKVVPTNELMQDIFKETGLD